MSSFAHCIRAQALPPCNAGVRSSRESWRCFTNTELIEASYWLSLWLIMANDMMVGLEYQKTWWAISRSNAWDGTFEQNRCVNMFDGCWHLHSTKRHRPIVTEREASHRDIVHFSKSQPRIMMVIDRHFSTFNGTRAIQIIVCLAHRTKRLDWLSAVHTRSCCASEISVKLILNPPVLTVRRWLRQYAVVYFLMRLWGWDIVAILLRYVYGWQ